MPSLPTLAGRRPPTAAMVDWASMKPNTRATLSNKFDNNWLDLVNLLGRYIHKEKILVPTLPNRIWNRMPAVETTTDIDQPKQFCLEASSLSFQPSPMITGPEANQLMEAGVRTNMVLKKAGRLMTFPTNAQLSIIFLIWTVWKLGDTWRYLKKNEYMYMHIYMIWYMYIYIYVIYIYMIYIYIYIYICDTHIYICVCVRV